ncbi:MAG TPA: AEC family transporter [Thermohalobaculum sp.]|nr:AEC family transporter [Thermohalobaculum sp.]
MSGFFEALSTAILPVFAVPAIAYLLGRRGVFDRATAEGINRFVFLMAVPAVTFHLLVTANVAGFEWGAVLGYLACEIAIYLGFAALAHFALGVGPRESLLLGMTCCFTNTVFFVLPIATALYGAEAALPMVAIITVDSTIVFAGTVMVMDVLSHREGGIVKVLTMLARNPLMVALALGAAVLALDIPLHDGLVNFARFLGNAAAPAALFSLGVIMSAVPLSRFGGASLAAALVKVAVMPLIVLTAVTLGAPGGTWPDKMVLIAAGPCGAMPFVVAMRYGVATDRIAAAIIMSTVISTFTLAVLA